MIYRTNQSLEARLSHAAEELDIPPPHLGFMRQKLGELNSYHPKTAMHCVNVGYLSSNIADYLGFNRKIAFTGGAMHDIGKLKIPLELLNKESGFNEDDYKIIRAHPIEGYKIITEESPYIVDGLIALYHHFGQNGNSYPKSGDLPEIPKHIDDSTLDVVKMYSRLVSIADHYDALSRRNDKFGMHVLSSDEKKRILEDLNPDELLVIENLYSEHILE